MDAKQNFKSKVESLVELFEFNENVYKSKDFLETQNRIQFIDPFFKALGWDVNNEQGYAEQYKEVVHEAKVFVKGKQKAPDYSFRLGGVRKFFVEAKKPKVKIKKEFDPSFQLRRYAWNAKLPISILTDFEEFSIYDTTTKPKLSDKVTTSRIDYIQYKEYPDRWEDIWNTFSKESILKGSFDKYAEKERKGKDTVDKEFLKEIEQWRNLLAKDLAINNPKLDTYLLNSSVQQIIDRIIFLRIAEDRGIEDYETLKDLIRYKNSYRYLVKHFKKAEKKYNSSLFDFKTDTLTPKLKVSDKIIDKIFENLYYPNSHYEFSVLGVDILGSVYEQFLGKVIRLTRGGNAKVEEKPEVKKAGGVYYTPKYIVDYIVENTVGKLVKEKTPRQVSKLKILDPACGSGSFLIGAYEYLLDWHLDYYTKNNPEKKRKALFKDNEDNYHLSSEEKKRILINNIYGVDIDSQAVEVTKLSLALKMLENENAETVNQQRKMFQERVLPDMSGNIKCGNSLISSDFYEGENMTLLDDKEKFREINAFDWDKQFPNIIKRGGFDAVIGNPPYVKARDYNEDKAYYREYLNTSGQYETLYKMWDLFVPFVEKGIKLLRRNGKFGYIIPDTLEKAEYTMRLKDWILDNFHVPQISFFPDSFIFYTDRKIVGVQNIILFVDKNKGDKTKKVVHKEDYRDIEKKEIVPYTEDIFTTYVYDIDFKKVDYKLLGDICLVSYGLRLNSHKGSLPKFVKKDLLREKKTKENKRRFTEGKFISMYRIDKYKWLEWDTERCPIKLVRPTFRELYNSPKLILGNINRVAAFDDQNTVCDNTLIVAKLYKDLLGISNSNLDKYFANVKKDRKILESNSQEFDLKYILALLNSELNQFYIKNVLRKGEKHAYPDDWKKMIIPIINKKTQKSLVQMVDKIIALKKRHLKTNDKLTEKQINVIENQINKSVYNIYKLTDSEIDIIKENVE